MHAPTFNRATTHLLCPTATGAKYARARAWGTPVVDMRWLSHIARTGAPPPPGMFLVADAEMSDIINRTRGIFLVVRHHSEMFRTAAKLPGLPQHGSTTASPQHAPQVHTPPPEATQQDADSVNKEEPFGRPQLLSSTDEVVPSSAPTSSPASSPSADPPLPPSSLSAHPSLVLSSHSSAKAHVPGGDTDDDEPVPRVPSSNTPSPLKLSAEHSDPAARALHESISNLLGKRNAGAMAIEDHAEPPPRRKRARPRFKVRFTYFRVSFRAHHVIASSPCLSIFCLSTCLCSETSQVRTSARVFPASMIHRQISTPRHMRSETDPRKGPQTHLSRRMTE